MGGGEIFIDGLGFDETPLVNQVKFVSNEDVLDETWLGSPLNGTCLFHLFFFIRMITASILLNYCT